ncbi:trehalose operon repressor [Risungbinella massiliensis]|uniref:trehalose operon repressor n=1 Tax=Risungbinella massiliensis TaxID=1329796 RepID=UPI0005CC3A45|nr:trehalose operon repressor [Risungbinella massiliensis]
MTNKFLKIYDELTTKIQEGKLPVGSMLPSEHDLTQMYQASRETIRKALTMLSEHGYIHKVRGKGSIVLDANKFNFPISGLVSFKELSQKMGQHTITHVEKLNKITPLPYVKDLLKLSKRDKVWELYRVREINSERIIFDKDFLVCVPNLTKEVCENSIYEYIEGELGLAISFARKEITIEEPTEEDRTYLDLDGHYNVVVVKNYVYLDDATLFQYTESRHRPDKFRFVDFARRN